MDPGVLQQLIHQAAITNAGQMDQASPSGAAASPPHDTSGTGKAAPLAFLAGLGADVGTTAYGNMTGKTHEANPLVKWAGDKGAAPATAAMGLGTLLLSRMLSHSHPTLAKAILYGMGGAHTTAALSNLHQMGLNQPVSSGTVTNNDVPPGPNMIKGPSGEWYDPNFATPIK